MDGSKYLGCKGSTQTFSLLKTREHPPPASLGDVLGPSLGRGGCRSLLLVYLQGLSRGGVALKHEASHPGTAQFVPHGPGEPFRSDSSSGLFLSPLRSSGRAPALIPRGSALPGRVPALAGAQLWSGYRGAASLPKHKHPPGNARLSCAGDGVR